MQPLLYYAPRYGAGMEEPADRLRKARLAAGYDTAKAAAEALGVNVSTYIHHENGTRGIPAKTAPIYARRFKVTAEWLLYGRGKPEGADIVDIWSRIPTKRRDEARAILELLTKSV